MPVLWKKHIKIKKFFLVFWSQRWGGGGNTLGTTKKTTFFSMIRKYGQNTRKKKRKYLLYIYVQRGQYLSTEICYK